MDRVLEIGGYAAGYCGRLFVHAGADVVRIPPHHEPPAWASKQAMDAYLHAGKRWVDTQDLTLIAELAANADIVICEAHTADEVLQLGLDDWGASTKVVITPFGRTGPKRNLRATPNVLLAMGGYTQLIGDADKAPLTLPGHYLEFQSGALAYTAANALRLDGHHATSDTSPVDISMLETLMSLSQFTTVRWHCCGELRNRHGSDFWYVVPSNLFACLDGWVYLNIVPTFWDPLTVFLEKPELLIDERFTTNDLRMENRDALHDMIAAVLAGQAKDDLIARAEACRVPLGVVQTFPEVLEDPHLGARDYWFHLDDEILGALKMPGMPYRINGVSHLPRRTQQRAHSAW